MNDFGWINIDITVFNYFILAFAFTVMLSYIVLAIVSAFSLKHYLRVNRLIPYKSLLAFQDAPRISILAPAYNEGFTIRENVLSLLSIQYNNFDVIVINDGSKDDSIAILVDAFELIPSDEVYVASIPTKQVKNVYISTNPTFSKLIVIDKENGGKADALNAGINFSKNPYVVCIDVDCIIEKDVLLKLSKPFLEATNKRIIATGGVVRIANSCIVKSGKLIKVNVPKNLIARIQVLEYLRAFVLGRMAWAKLDGLLLISGAFGMFDKEIILKVGGYNTNTVGEDMELVVRMRRYMIENKFPYTLKFIPDPLCWTEAPESYEILGKQRSRWTRGTMETLWIHRKMFFNPRYKILGMISYPYWLFYEYLAPIIELTGLLISLLMVYYGILSWSFFGLLSLFVYTFALFFSVLAIFTEEATFKKYESKKDIFKLVWAALLEPFIFHPFLIYAALKGNWQKIKGSHSWGDMTRKGFEKKPE
ncbi:glycosyltransferase [Flavobacterium cucumis]|uniref:Glycosyltransferase, catalytic subunit of cellulose synthase and poly-beta-1,6-N-acetylglucosamine synthase n=1 Tax=Flavobacterium cucumis TaxID=416016 RepID=A0A1M7ZXX4_9FLAO|nr:glycosyltransferase [Flavobacterium cucumis]SHO73673.1 Glycosyltransferase, catalytic subunit of cellulose synthase and poly-beta-1,6-N-acetylglucosamine synthase [Flavobacterium cucumis]